MMHYPTFFWSVIVTATTLVVAATHHHHASHATSDLTPQAAEHWIEDLPNYRDPHPISFRNFAGHLALPSNGQKMFYWFVESQSSPEDDPLVMWLNGGPGCSSLGGFFTELGPFVVESDLTVKLNPYAWNRKANVVFLESPAGVGFSQPVLNATDYNDDVTTDRIREFLGQFLAAFPTLHDRPFYVTGESYAGVYVPYLVDTLLRAPVDGLALRGLAVGNPYTDANIDGNAYMDYFYAHALISMENYDDMVAKCETEIGRCMFTQANCSAPCQAAVKEGLWASDMAYFNPYYIYGDVCLLANDQGGMLHHRKDMNIRPMHRGKIEPCTDKYTQDYLNLNDVQRAIHVDGPGLVAWSNCNMDIATTYTRSLSALPKYHSILAQNLTVLIYSGDADAVVNFMGTERWIASDKGLHLPVQDKWKSWFGPDRQLAGYSQTYAGLTFKTVKGAGHMVPAIRPLHGLFMFECFLYGDAACATFDYPQDNLEYLSGQVEDPVNTTAVAASADGAHLGQASLLWSVGVGLVAGAAAFVALQVMHTQARRAPYHAL
ncbi:Aste57867_11585 [Aphanomyces stellatus]|uniref:Carboxypeptidase n=1 Tax=Aphanomyces stellatus TaxID=120398 RepID=A0A485KTE2_9STRA|nr:hypothetical protein As57867_011542 [Aphanomyces stellatus]VFT88444.1 Aste57867_11585 [Aphanomyces stellatus]